MGQNSSKVSFMDKIPHIRIVFWVGWCFLGNRLIAPLMWWPGRKSLLQVCSGWGTAASFSAPDGRGSHWCAKTSAPPPRWDLCLTQGPNAGDSGAEFCPPNAFLLLNINYIKIARFSWLKTIICNLEALRVERLLYENASQPCTAEQNDSIYLKSSPNFCSDYFHLFNEPLTLKFYFWSSFDATRITTSHSDSTFSDWICLLLNFKVMSQYKRFDSFCTGSSLNH